MGLAVKVVTCCAVPKLTVSDAIVFCAVRALPLLTSCKKNWLPFLTQTPVVALPSGPPAANSGPAGEPIWISTIETPGAFYIALIEEKKPGKVRPFDESVQTQIDTQLRNEQFRKERMLERDKLVKDAVWRSSADMMNIAFEMAMQNYPRWHAK